MPPDQPFKGRGTASNPGNRFERLHYEPDPDFYDEHLEIERPRTEFLRDTSKTILSKNDSPDIGFDFSVNPYRGCEHGCIYCYARPFHEYLGFSAGLDFETKILVKPDAADLLRQEFRKKSWKPQWVSVSGITDAYQPIEKKLGLTRQVLEVFREFRNPVSLVTKNALIARDIDILRDLAALNLTTVYISVTTLDNHLVGVMEPRTSRPARRLETIRHLADAGIPVGVLMAPIIPGLNDHEIPQVLEACRDAGATTCTYVLARFSHGLGDLFSDWLEEHFPDRKDKVLNRLRAMRNGKLVEPRFGHRMRGEGVFADQINAMFTLWSRKLGFERRHPKLTTEHFRRPGEAEQLSLFDTAPGESSKTSRPVQHPGDEPG